MPKSSLLYVINSLNPGGAEHALLHLLEHGFFKNVDIKIFAFFRGRDGFADRIINAAGAQNVTIVSPSESANLKGFAIGAIKLWQQIANSQPDKIVLSLKQANIIGRFLCLFTCKPTVISFEHSAKYRAGKLNFIYAPILWLLSFRVNEVWADCDSTLRTVTKYFTSSRKRIWRTVPLFVVDDTLAIKDDYAIGKKIKLLTVGRLTLRKQQHKIIKALADLVDAHLTIIGSGPDEAVLRKIAAEYHVQQQVTFAGFKGNWVEDAPDYDILIHASDNEGFCLVTAEAMAAGLPVIAQPVGGIADYGVNGFNMIQLKTAAPQEIADAVETLIADGQLRRNIGQQAAEDMRKKFNKSNLTKAAKIFFGSKA